MLAALRRSAPRVMTRVRLQAGHNVSCPEPARCDVPQGLAQSVEPRVSQLLINGKFVPSQSGKVRCGGVLMGTVR